MQENETLDEGKRKASESVIGLQIGTNVSARQVSMGLGGDFMIPERKP